MELWQWWVVWGMVTMMVLGVLSSLWCEDYVDMMKEWDSQESVEMDGDARV